MVILILWKSHFNQVKYVKLITLFLCNKYSTSISFPGEYRIIQSKESGSPVSTTLSLGCEPGKTYAILCVILDIYLIIMYHLVLDM